MIICNILFWSISPINVNAQSPLWNPNYNKVQKLVFDNSASAENLVNFTVLVHLNSSIIDWDDFQTDGSDIRFIDEDYETWLSYEIETWNHGYDAWIWVRVPQIDMDSAIDHIYMYYDNPHAVNGEDKEGTWNDNYVMVQHMVDETNTSVLDSTQHDNDGTKKGVNEPVETTGGQIDSAQDFDGNNDQVNIIDDISLAFGVNNFTFEAWIKTSDSTHQAIISKYNTTTPKLGVVFYITNIGKIGTWTFADNADFTSAFSTTAGITDDVLHYVVVVREYGDKYYFYIDGSDAGSVVDATVGTITNTLDLVIGRRNVGGYSFNGIIDEVRVYNDTLSNDWIKAQYLSMTENYITYKELSLCESKANIFPLVLIALFVIIGIVVVSRT